MNKLKDLINKPYEVEDVLQPWVGTVSAVEKLEDGKWVEVKSFGPNKFILGGIQQIMWFLFRKDFVVKIKSFEEDLYADAKVNELANITVTDEVPQVLGYNIAFDGSVGTDVVPYEKHKKGYDFDNLIPFRVIPVGDNNYAEMMTKYAHFRIKTYKDSAGTPHDYVEYFTKKIDVTYKVTTDEDDLVPDYPDENLTTDKDIRILAQFLVFIEEDEMREWFALTKKGMESTRYNAIIPMMGKSATITKDGNVLKTMKDSYACARKNHVPIPHGVDGTITLRYSIRVI